MTGRISIEDGRRKLRDLGDVTFVVTQEDIAKGVPGDSLSCPISAALGRHLDSTLGPGFSVRVHMKQVIISWWASCDRPWANQTPTTESYEMDLDLIGFIKAFDRGRPVNSRKITLRVPLYRRLLSEL